MRIKSKKKLALLVSMALTVGSSLAVNPMDTYAATSVTWDATNNYTVTVGDKTESVEQAADAITKIIAGLNTVADKDITINLNDEATWQKDADSKAAAKALAGALRGQAVTLKEGAKVNLTFADGDAYTFVNGSGASNVKLTSEKVLEVKGNIDTVTAQVNGDRTAKIDVAEGNKVGTITVKDGTAGTLELSGTGTVGELDAQGNINVTANGIQLEKIAVAKDKTLAATGDVKAGSITGDGNVTASGALTVTGAINAGTVEAKSVTAESVTADVTADSLELTGSDAVTVGSDSKKWEVGTLRTEGALTVEDASKLTAKSIESTGDLNLSDTTNNLSATNIASGGDLTITKADTLSATNINAQKGLTVTAGDLNVDTLSVNGALNVGENTITADSIAFGDKATITVDGDKKANINANTVTIDTASMTADEIKKLSIAPKTAGDKVKVTVVTSNGSVDGEIKEAIQQVAGGEDKVDISVTSADAEEAEAAAEAASANADAALKKAVPWDAKKIEQANPFTEKLPSASDIAAVASPTKEKELEAARQGLEGAITQLETQISAVSDEGLKKKLELKRAELESQLNGLSSTGLQAKAAELTAAVQQAGKTAAAPGVASARTAAVVTNVMTANVTSRTSELRGFASAVDEGRPAPDNVWFQYKHTNMDVDNGDVYGKSTVKTNNYQLGYDVKVGPNDYLGAYVGTTTGNVEFNGPAVSDRTDIKNAYDFGIYGTHMLPSDQYIDYMIHTGKFDSKYNGEKWGTTDTGLMVGYGVKITQDDSLTWNPYIQLAYDKVSVDSYMAGPNYIASDDSNNWTAKLGINLLDVSGFYGGLAYSRGLSGSYNAYINGVPMPTQDNNANVLYMSLGYRANMSRNVFLDLSMEKTFADYNGWTAAGKVNFYF